MAYTATYTGDGGLGSKQLANVELSSAGRVAYNSKVDGVNKTETGNVNRSYDVNTKEIDHGTKIGGTALQMAIEGKPNLYSEVVKAYESNDLNKTSSEISATSSSIMGGIRSYVEQNGQNSNRAIGQAYTLLGVDLPKFIPIVSGKAGFEGRMVAETDKTTSVNLMTKALDDVQTNALKEGERLGYSGRALESHVAAKTGQFVNTWKAFATSDQEHGAAKPIKAISNTAQKVVDSGAPLPMASQGEQERRLSELQRNLP